jgi:HD-like signal output (HDOD) protein
MIETQPTAAKVRRDSWAAELPPFPAIAIEAVRLLSSDEVPMKELGELLRADQVFSARILRLSNSPLLGFGCEIKSIVQATTLLGAERIKSLVFTAGLRSYLARPLRIPALRQCWRHSLACAVVAGKLGLASLMEEGFAYSAGLLHDIGRLGLMTTQSIGYARFLETVEGSALQVLDQERELFGMDHCEAGQWLAVSWKLPQVFGVVAALHHSWPRDDKFDIVALVRAACALADALGFAAVSPFFPQAVEDIMMGLPERVQGRFSAYAGQLAIDVTRRVSSLE